MLAFRASFSRSRSGLRTSCFALHVQKSEVNHLSTLKNWSGRLVSRGYQQSRNGGKQRRSNPYSFPRISDGAAVWGIVGINTAVFGLWISAQNNVNENPSLIRKMYQNFVVSWDNVFTANRWWTLITSAFSHADFSHFIINMLVFTSFGPPVAAMLGGNAFVLFYIGAGVASSAAHLMYTRYILPRLKRLRFYGDGGSRGASGAVTGISLLFALVWPTATVTLFFVVPLPAIFAVGGFVAYDLYRASTVTSGRIDTAGHLGGALYGVAYWAVRLRTKRRF
ncbi:hypothetical protein BJ742DRAFT_826870 [Cladochytrium replicatum]|nr:hypothetical protein BJ742DRAFT_826870 [Cladochytrium replicatum]